MKYIYLFLWSFYLISSPFYFFDSGNPQVSDGAIIVIAICFILEMTNCNSFKLPTKAKRIIFYLLLFVIYTLSVNLLWVFVLGDFSLLIYSFYYIYNSIVFIFFLSLYTKYKEIVLKITLLSIIICILIQGLLSTYMSGFSLRGILYFNNPNQLAYFSLIIGVILLLNIRYVGYYKGMTCISLLITIYLCLLSLSKSVILGMIFLFLIYMVKKPLYFLIFLYLLTASFQLDIIGNTIDKPLIKNTINRISQIGHDKDDSLTGRGFDRIYHNYEYLFFGAGEGAKYRFNSMELHSSWGTLLFSYGIIGFGLFLFFLYILFKDLSIWIFVHFLPIITYGLTHHGLRFTHFWVLLGFIYILHIRVFDKKNILN